MGGAEGGGGGGVDLDGGGLTTGNGGAAVVRWLCRNGGGAGGRLGGSDAVADAKTGGGGGAPGRGGPKVGGFREVRGGGGGRLPGNGGGTLPGRTLFESFDVAVKVRSGRLIGTNSEDGKAGLLPGSTDIEGRLFGTNGTDGGMDVVESIEYDEDLLAPVSIPPVRFFSFGIPPANNPPSCGASAKLTCPPVVSLLLLVLLISGLDVSPPGGLRNPGIGGALVATAGPPLDLSTVGAERSLVTAFFNRAPFVISVRSAP